MYYPFWVAVIQGLMLVALAARAVGVLSISKKGKIGHLHRSIAGISPWNLFHKQTQKRGRSLLTYCQSKCLTYLRSWFHLWLSQEFLFLSWFCSSSLCYLTIPGLSIFITTFSSVLLSYPSKTSEYLPLPKLFASSRFSFGLGNQSIPPNWDVVFVIVVFWTFFYAYIPVSVQLIVHPFVSPKIINYIRPPLISQSGNLAFLFQSGNLLLHSKVVRDCV